MSRAALAAVGAALALTGCGSVTPIVDRLETRAIETITTAEAAADRVRDAAVEDAHHDLCQRMRVGDLFARQTADPGYFGRWMGFCQPLGPAGGDRS